MACKTTKTYIKGGKVKGPGTATSDSIPAQLSNGEFVVKAKVVAKPGVLDFLQKLNNEELFPKKMKDGGFVETAKNFGTWLNEKLKPGVIEQRYDAEQVPIPYVKDALVPVTPTNERINTANIENKIYPKNDVKFQTNKAQSPKLNLQTLQDRISLIEQESDPAKRQELNQKLREQIQDINLDPETTQNALQMIPPLSYAEGGLVQGEFNWENFVEAKPENTTSDFKWETFEPVIEQERSLAGMSQEAEQPYPEEIGKGRAALIGAGQGATFGFGEELTAPIVAAGGMVAGALSPEQKLPTLPGESTWDKYQRLMQTYRDVAREEQQAAQAQQPIAYTAGALAGGLTAPGLGVGKVLGATKGMSLIPRVAAGSLTGAGIGGLAGAGEAEGTVEERLPAAGEGAKTGSVVGAALPVAGAALSTGKKVASKIGKMPVIEDIVKSFQRGVKGENLITKTGRQEASDVVRQKGGELYKDIKTLQDEVGTKITNEIDAAREAGKKVDLSEEVNDVLARLEKIKAEGSQEAAAYATSVEKEIKKVLGIKSQEKGFMGVPSKDLPEGLIVPEAPTVDLTQIDPKKAQDLKQVLFDYTPKKGMAPQELEPARIAGELRGNASGKLSSLTYKLPELNEQYGAIKDSLKRLKINEKALPTQIEEKINNVVTKLEKQNVTGDNARKIIEDVLADIKQVSPTIATKYRTQFNDIVERLNLAEKIIKGGESISLTGTPKAAAMTVSNVAGLAAGKVGGRMAGPVGQGVNKLAETPLVKQSIVRSQVQSPEAIQKMVEPYKIQRQVANTAENAEPETLQTEANRIRKKYGQQGEQLSTILEKMSTQDKDARRALMFSILQNAAYRKMLELIPEESTNE